jgi:hypothetical protein
MRSDIRRHTEAIIRGATEKLLGQLQFFGTQWRSVGIVRVLLVWRSEADV